MNWRRCLLAGGLASRRWRHCPPRGIQGDKTCSSRLKFALLFSCLHEGFTLGYARQVVDLLEKQLIVRSKVKTRVAEWPDSWGDRMAPLGKARLFVKWIRRYMEVNFPSVSLQEALTPMDLRYWSPTATQRGGLDPHNAERDLLARYFKPLAAARGADLDKGISGYLRVRSLADEIRKSDVASVPEYWGQSLRQRSAAKHYEDFVKIALPALAQFTGNGELEGNFSSLASIDLVKRGCDPLLKRATAKLRLDGPHPNEFSKLRGSGCAATSASTGAWVAKVQSMYLKLFGEKDMREVEKKRHSGVWVDARKGIKRPHAFRGLAEAMRKRKRLLDTLASLPAAASVKQCIFGDAPSKSASAALRALPNEMLEASDDAKATFVKLGETARKRGEQLISDRQKFDPALHRHLKEMEEREKAIEASSLMAVATNPMTEYKAGKRCSFGVLSIYGPSIAVGDRKLLEGFGNRVTTQMDRAFPADRPVPVANVLYVQNMTAFLDAPRDRLGWKARMHGMGIVDRHWVETVRRCCHGVGATAMPPPLNVRFNGMRVATQVLMTTAFIEEEKDCHN